ncbi:MAG: thiamine phosphate synthase [Gemmatimonadota bacterium]
MITDARIASPRSIVDVVRVAVDAGAPAVQLREKKASARELAMIAEELLGITRPAGALLFVNDRIDVAIAVGADGVHLGPDDVPVATAQEISPAGFLIGASTDEPDRARALVAAGVDYIGCGTVFATSTKLDAGEPIGLSGLQRVTEAVPVPVVGIGGIDALGSHDVATSTDAAGVAVIGSVMGADNPAEAVRSILAPWHQNDR